VLKRKKKRISLRLKLSLSAVIRTSLAEVETGGDKSAKPEHESARHTDKNDVDDPYDQRHYREQG